ncbi:MAG: pyridoxal-dependent decarboxylase [Comamonadaceae bacterium]|nr:pyridoxal-dependent decarboxylase [Comamonadaceae bacterium]
MTPEEFRRHGRAVVDWVADYYERVESLPVLSRVKPGEIRAALPAHPPQQGEPFEAVLEDLDDADPARHHPLAVTQFLRLLPGQRLGPGDPGRPDLLGGLGVQGMLWATSPACTELETHVLDWMAEMLDLPRGFRSTGRGGGVIQDSASSAALCALLAARERATGLASNERGCDGRLDRLRLDPGPLVHREGGQDRRHRPRRTCA